MRVVLIIAAVLLVAVSAAAVVSDAEPIRQYLSQVTLALAILVLIGVFSQPRQKMPPLTPPPPKSAGSIGAMGLRKLCDKSDGYVSIVFGPPGYRVK